MAKNLISSLRSNATPVYCFKIHCCSLICRWAKIYCLPLPAGGQTREQKSQRKILAEEALAEVEMAGFFYRDPATLSGGQKARVALVRVLLSKPSALLLDEPFSKLDAQLRDQIRRLVFSEARRQNLPTVLVSHDVADAKAANGEVINLEN